MQPLAVTFDIGGVIYSDDVFKRAIFTALNKLSTGIEQAAFDQIYQEHLKSQSGSLRSKLCQHFLGSLETVSYTLLRAHETKAYLVCRLLLE